MSEKELIKQIRKLPSEAQQEAADFVEFLIKKYVQKTDETQLPKKKSIVNNSFRGVWKNRIDLKDSSDWVREIRKSMCLETYTLLTHSVNSNWSWVPGCDSSDMLRFDTEIPKSRTGRSPASVCSSSCSET